MEKGVSSKEPFNQNGVAAGQAKLDPRIKQLVRYLARRAAEKDYDAFLSGHRGQGPTPAPQED